MIKTKPIGWKTYIVPLIIILLLFIAASYFIISSINTYLLKNMMQDSNKQADNHISRLVNSINANKIIDELLEDRLISICNIVIRNHDNLSDQALREMGEDLKVDKIYWYNAEGEIIYTANDYLGWSAAEDHPVYDFMKSDKRILIEDIRKDSESDNYFKYAYAKSDYGEFVQVGISADNIKELTMNFCPQKFMNELVMKEDISHVYYLNDEFEVLLCDEATNDKNYKLNDLERAAIKENKPYYGKKSYNDEDTYEALLPIYVDNIKNGTLIILYSLENTNSLINKITLIVLLLLILIFLVYGIMVINVIRKNKKIEELAYYDSITKLFNKNYFLTFLKDELENSGKNKRALLIINCSNLNLVKLIFGQEVLDNLLIEKANKLRKLDIKENYLFRYSEDSMCIYVNNYIDKNCLIEKSNRILDAFDEISATIENNKLISTKIGILEIEEDYKKIEDITKHIEILIDKIDDTGDKRYGFFDETIQNDLILGKIIEKELRKATYNGYHEFYLEYQPQVDLKTNKIVGFEALARWNNKELGIISPLNFIDIAERFRLITSLGKWILETACDFIKSIENKGISGIKVAVNISVIQLLQENFVEDVMTVVGEAEINPANLELEITETNLINNYEIVNRKLKLLRKEGISISLDDFGTGYASLAHLKNLNIDVLKIDKFFIDNITKTDKDDIFIKSIILLANELGLKIVAEGVEQEEQRQYLRTNGCDMMQGYLFSRPVTGDKAIKFIENIKGEV